MTNEIVTIVVIFVNFFKILYRLGLCNDSINQITRDMPPPTPADLQGFWEMVLLQVENVDSLYAELDKLRANGWKVSHAKNCIFLFD